MRTLALVLALVPAAASAQPAGDGTPPHLVRAEEAPLTGEALAAGLTTAIVPCRVTLDGVTAATPLGILREDFFRAGNWAGAAEFCSKNFWNAFLGVGSEPGSLGETSVIAMLIGATKALPLYF